MKALISISERKFVHLRIKALLRNSNININNQIVDLTAALRYCAIAQQNVVEPHNVAEVLQDHPGIILPYCSAELHHRRDLWWKAQKFIRSFIAKVTITNWSNKCVSCKRKLKQRRTATRSFLPQIAFIDRHTALRREISAKLKNFIIISITSTGLTGEPGIIREQTACTPKNGITCPLPKAGFSIPQCSNREDNINLNCLKNKDKPQYGIGETCCGNNSSCTVKREDEKVTASNEDQILSEETNVKCLDVVCVGHNEGTSNSENDCLTPEAVIEKYLFIMEIIEACFDSLESIKKEPAKVNSSEETTIEMMDDCDVNLINIEGFSGEPGIIREQTACMPKNGITCPLPKTGVSRPQCSNREDNINLNCLKNKDKPQYDIGETCCGNNNNCTENSFVTNRNESLGKREEEKVTASTKDQILSEQINRCLDFVCVRHNEGTSTSENDCLTAEAGEEYCFNMSLKLKNPEYAVKAGKPKGQHIKITESYVTNNEGKQECGLMIEGGQTILKISGTSDYTCQEEDEDDIMDIE
ncbi:hypothetical protein C0J52_18625 [Blattella germanica]|nr:hypothetical protein C0J52_18625 [Blattella germanica]